MSAEQHKTIVRRWIEEAWNHGNIDVADQIYSPAYCARGRLTEGGEAIKGIANIKRFVLETRKAFPDLCFTIEHLIAENDKVVGVFTLRGTHTGYLDAIAPTGRKIEITAIDVWRFENGRIVERCAVSIDRLGLLQQLGVIRS